MSFSYQSEKARQQRARQRRALALESASSGPAPTKPELQRMLAEAVANTARLSIPPVSKGDHDATDH